MNDPCQRCSYSPTATVIARYSMDLQLSAVSQNRMRGRTSEVTRRMYSALRNKFERLIRAELEKSPIPEAKGKRRVTFTRLYRKRKRPYDSDNLVAGFKGARDVLTRLGLTVDDSPAFIEAHYTQEPGAEDGVRITLEDIQW